MSFHSENIRHYAYNYIVHMLDFIYDAYLIQNMQAYQ